MIDFLRGELAAVTADAAIIDVGGVGYRVSMAGSSLSKLPAVGQEVRIATYLQVSDAGIALFGFLADEERALFEQLIQVKGIGPKGALAALGAYQPSDLVRFITSEDAAALRQIPGVGAKTASRIIVELKGVLAERLGSYGALLESTSGGGASAPVNASALDALMSMGFTETEAAFALNGAPADADEAALVTYALKRLGSQ